MVLAFSFEFRGAGLHGDDVVARLDVSEFRFEFADPDVQLAGARLPFAGFIIDVPSPRVTQSLSQVRDAGLYSCHLREGLVAFRFGFLGAGPLCEVHESLREGFLSFEFRFEFADPDVQLAGARRDVDHARLWGNSYCSGARE